MITYSAPQLLDKVNAYLEQMPYSRPPKGLYEPIAYELSLGGKRIRPVLMLMAYNLFKEDVDCILSQAAGLETYHNHTLLHDDVMDKADMRRNKPTVHNVWNENTAILSGDAMLILAYRLIADCPKEKLPEVLHLFTETTMEICEGQQWDMEFETRMDVKVDEYIEMIRLKTSVLLAAALKMGAFLADAPVRAMACRRDGRAHAAGTAADHHNIKFLLDPMNHLVLVHAAAALHGGTVLVDHPTETGTRITMSLAIRTGSGAKLRSPMLKVDYAGERDHGLLEFADILPSSVYDPRK